MKFINYLFIITSIFIPITSFAVTEAENDNGVITKVYVTSDGKKIFGVFDGVGYKPSHVLMSDDYGKTWNTLLTDNQSLSTLISFANDNNTAYLGGFEESVVLKDNGDIDYLSRHYKNFGYASLAALNISSDDNKIFMGGQDSDDDAAWLFVGTKDQSGQINWQDSSEPAKVDISHCTLDGLGPLNINAIASSSNRNYLATSDLNQQISNWGICRSDDGGKYWYPNQTFPQPNSSAIFAATKNSVVFASGHDDEAEASSLYFSRDAGDTWQKIKLTTEESPFVTSISGSQDAKIIFVGAVTNANVHVSGGLWLLKYNEATKNWDAQKTDLPDIRSVSASSDAKVIAVSGWDGTVWVSSDFGKTWNKVRL